MSEFSNPRITVDAEDVAEESSLVDELGMVMAGAAWPGVFSGGKQIVATEHTHATADRSAVLSFRFNDGSVMNIIGDFEVRYKTMERNLRSDLAQAGKELMKGKYLKIPRDEAKP